MTNMRSNAKLQWIISFVLTWLVSSRPTIQGDRYTIENPISLLLRKHGVARFSNGYEIPYNRENKKSIVNLVYFIMQTGIRFGEKNNQWKLGPVNGTIQTHQGIKLSLHTIGLIEETFLYQIHFSGFDLKEKVVITGGAYIGDTPLFYSYYGAKVYAFEPDPNSFSQAIANVQMNPGLSQRIIMSNYGIGADEEIDFPIGVESSGGSSMYLKYRKNTAKVRFLSITTILQHFNISDPYLLDLDIKGSEFNVIEDESVKKFHKVRIEYSPYLMKSSQKSLDYLIDKLKSYGFVNMRVYKHNDLRFDLVDHGVLEAEK